MEKGTRYVGRDTWINQRTGEVREMDMLEKSVDSSRNGFMITYLAEIINMMETLGTKKLQVVKYILSNMCKTNNTLVITVRELADACNMSTRTVLTTLKMLEDAGIITRRTGAIMVSPKLCNNWRAGKEASMMITYKEFGEKNTPAGGQGSVDND